REIFDWPSRSFRKFCSSFTNQKRGISWTNGAKEAFQIGFWACLTVVSFQIMMMLNAEQGKTWRKKPELDDPDAILPRKRSDANRLRIAQPCKLRCCVLSAERS